jgi:hypothetical protein
MELSIVNRQLSILLAGLMIVTACDTNDEKQAQYIEFEEIAPQQLRNGSTQLQATASSGLPVAFVCWDTTVAVITDDQVQFRKAGTAGIVAIQPGNDRFYEAPSIMRQLIIRDWDPNKKNQTIDFELPADWKLTQDGTAVPLKAVASSGLPVGYVLSATRYGFISNAPPFYLYLYHAGENGISGSGVYNAQISVVASQIGNDEYNPADNVAKTMRVIGDVFH